MRLKSHLPEDSSNKRKNPPRQTKSKEVTESPVKRKRTTRKNTDDTPVKLDKNCPETPGIFSPGTVFQAPDTPKTPRIVKDMMNQKQSLAKPMKQNDALHLTELTAFKIDDKAYNSYLYTGKMKIPLNSSIAREDYASELGARQNRNIRIRSHSSSHVKKTLHFNDSDDGEEQTEDMDDQHSQSKQPKRTTRKHPKYKRLKTEDEQDDDDDGDSDDGNRDGDDDTDTGTETPTDGDWELDVSDEDALLSGLHDSSQHQTSEANNKFTRLNMRLRRTQSLTQPSLHDNDDGDDNEHSSTDDDHHDDNDDPDTGRRTTRKRGKQSHHDDESGNGESEDHDKENTPVNTRGRRKTLTDKHTTPAKQKAKDSHPVHPIIPQTTRRITRNALSTPHSVTFQHGGFNSNASTVYPSFECTTDEEDGYKIVPVVVKYPLMGSLTDWKDSFQTCSEETVMYRQICTWKCPYLLRYYGTHGPGIVFEFVDGESLDGYLSANEIDTIQHRWLWSELGLHITTALLYLHKLNISHNDIKPENVRYSESKKIWKLLDLGLATDFDMKVSRGIGTNGYRAPEVAQNGRIHKNSDVYGLGVMMDDALESIMKRYKVFERIFDDYQFCLDQYEEDDSSDEEVDVEQSAVMILDNLIRRRNANNLAIDVDNAMYVMEYAKKYNELLKYMKSIVTASKLENPDERPSIHRLISSFRYTLAIEKDILEAFLVVRSMGIY